MHRERRKAGRDRRVGVDQRHGLVVIVDIEHAESPRAGRIADRTEGDDLAALELLAPVRDVLRHDGTFGIRHVRVERGAWRDELVDEVRHRPSVVMFASHCQCVDLVPPRSLHPRVDDGHRRWGEDVARRPP
jgi:hypothetical protein